MLQRLLLSLIAAGTLALSGCALSPQQLNPDPVFKGQPVAVGQGQPVVVKVVDGRQSTELGTRGGLYSETSAVTVRSHPLGGIERPVPNGIGIFATR